MQLSFPDCHFSDKKQLLIKQLFFNFLVAPDSPRGLQCPSCSTWPLDDFLFLGIWAYIWPKASFSQSIANQSLQILLLLVNQSSESRYRKMLGKLRDVDPSEGLHQSSPASGDLATISTADEGARVPFRLLMSKIYRSTCHVTLNACAALMFVPRDVEDDRAMLLFYFLLRENYQFFAYVLASVDLDQLVCVTAYLVSPLSNFVAPRFCRP